jgi:hypothetical protein
VGERFTQAENFVETYEALAFDYIGQLANKYYEIFWTGPTYTREDLMGLDTLQMPDPGLLVVDPISVADVDFEGNRPDPASVIITSDPAPEFSAADPNVREVPVPDAPFPVFSANPPDITDPEIPTAPTITLPPLPVLDAISIPGPPDYNLPQFEGSPPVADLTPPEPVYSFTEEAYTSDVNDAIKDKLVYNIQQGGTGLDEATEQAIYDRATARQELENQQAYDEALSFFASRGFPLPPGALAAGLMEVNYKINRVREDINNDILVQQSKLAQDNTHFMMSAGLDYEEMWLTYHNSKMARAFESAKFVVESAVIIYGIKVEYYKAQLQAYQALAVVYKARIDGEIAKAEMYKAQIAGVSASVDAQRALIEAYTAQVNGVKTLVDMYVAEMQGAKIRTEVDLARVQNFKALVEAYAAQVEAVTARYEAYKAEIQGELTKVELYKAQAQAYESVVEGYKAKAGVDIARAEATLKVKEQEVAIYRADIEKYLADVESAVKEAAVKVSIERLDVEVFKARIARLQADIDGTSRAYAARIEESKSIYDMQLKEVDMTIRTLIAQYELANNGLVASSQVASQMLAAAFGSVSATASLGYREARSDSTSYGTSNSFSGNINHSLMVAHYNNYYP